MHDKYMARLKIVGEHELAEYMQRLYDERNKAIDDLQGLCSVCKHNNTKVCDSCTHTASIFEVYGDADNWEWRGIENV